MSGVSYPPVQFTGWASYADTQYTSGSPLAISGNAIVAVPNNAGTVIETQLPPDLTTLYSGGKIRAKNGDALLLTIDFAGTPSTATETHLDVWLDIGGAIGEFYRTTVTFPKGNGATHRFAIALGPYAGATWEANGATVYCQPNANLSLYEVRYMIQRVHKSR